MNIESPTFSPENVIYGKIRELYIGPVKQKIPGARSQEGYLYLGYFL